MLQSTVDKVGEMTLGRSLVRDLKPATSTSPQELRSAAVLKSLGIVKSLNATIPPRLSMLADAMSK